MDRPSRYADCLRISRRLLGLGMGVVALSLFATGCTHAVRTPVDEVSSSARGTSPSARENQPGTIAHDPSNPDPNALPSSAEKTKAEADHLAAENAFLIATAKEPGRQPVLPGKARTVPGQQDYLTQPSQVSVSQGAARTPATPVQPSAAPRARLSIEAAGPILPIGLDTVFRLAEEQNPRVAIARARVREAYAEKDIARTKWLPDMYVGTAYYRHEGGIVNEDGSLTHSSFGAMFAGAEFDSQFDIRDVAYQQVNAQRKVWQQKGELSKITSETLLDASSTYIDWLSARSGEAVAQKLEQHIKDLLQLTKGLQAAEPGLTVEVARVQAELDGEQQLILKLRQQAGAAAAKLIYLLGLDPSSELTPIDPTIVPFDLIDAHPATAELVAQALSTGPGIREMEGLLTLIQESIERSQGPGRLFPVMQMRMAEGGFGAGPGDRMDWDNRWDLGLQARWNLTELASLRDRRRAAQAKIQQAHLAYQDLRAKLTAGVQEAREAILSGSAQMRRTENQIRDARQAFDLSNLRFKNRIPGSSASEVLLAIAALGRAQSNYLTVTSAYDKAQLRLMVLLGPDAMNGPKPASQLPNPGGNGQ